MAISFSLSELVALAVESFAMVRIYVALFALSVKVLLSKRKTISGAGTLLGLAGIFGVLITWHIFTDAVRLVYAFKRDGDPTGPDNYYTNVSSAMSLIKTTLYLVITIIFDAFILHRSWVVWDRNFLVILLPFLIFLADIALQALASHPSRLSQASLRPTPSSSGSRRGSPSRSSVRPSPSLFASPLVADLVCFSVLPRSLIAYRLWTRRHTARDSRKAFGFTREVAIMAESGAIYSVTLIIIIATYATKSNSFNVFLDMASPIIGIAFSLVVLRLGVAATDPTHITMEGMGEPIPEDNRSVTGSVVKESRPQSEALVGF
ncbi:hypothetical protein BJV78DRAFT_1227176 [Lactifluus subvellereus]|nr:hypothetical protein BJV78DRAFT_1227176 [Lactifluus subvellereus]